MRVLGIDLGERHVGVAVHDDPDLPARPLTTLEVRGADPTAAIVACARSERADEIVIGLPLRTDGKDGLAARAARRIAEAVAKASGLPVHLEDERLTTTQAHRHRVAAGVRGRSGIDERAAAILLQTFVDRRSGRWRTDDPQT